MMPTVMAKFVWKLFGRLGSQRNISVLPSRDNSLVAQMVKNLPAKPETQVRPLGWEWLPTPVFLPGEFHRGAWQATIHGITKSQTLMSD